MAARTPASWIQGGSHSAENDRNLLTALVGTPGIVGSADLAVTANGTPNMTVNVAAGAAFIAGTEATYQGKYHAFNDATVNLIIAASNATNPRIDIVVARVRDAFYSGASNDFSLVVVTGTPAGTPAAPATPADSIVLARVAVAATVTTIVAGNITDYRARSVALTNTYKARAYSSGTQNLTGPAFTQVALDTETYDPNSNFTTGASAHYTCPVSGYYYAGARSSIGNAVRFIPAVFKNGVEAARGVDVSAGGGGSVSDLILCAAGDLLSFWAYVGAAATLDLGSVMTYFSVHYLSS